MEKIKVYVPINDVVFGVDGFKDMREALELDPESFDFHGAYIVVDHEWLAGHVETDLDEWEDEYTVDETEGMIFDAIKNNKLIAYGIGEEEKSYKTVENGEIEMKKYKLAFEWTVLAEVEVEANSYEEALEYVEYTDLSALDIEHLDGIVHNVQMNKAFNEDDKEILNEIEEYHKLY